MRQMISKACVYCGKEYQRPLCEAKRSNMKFCSISCGVSFRNKFLKKSPLELFYKNIIVPKDKDQCWLWQKNKTARYGVIKINSKPVLAHRFSYENFNGIILSGMYVCHKCDTPKCVNPSHLFLGDAKINAQDKMNKGRHRAQRGEKQGSSKLKDYQIKEIRLKLKQDISQKAIAKEYNIRQSTISKINNGHAWKHVT